MIGTETLIYMRHMYTPALCLVVISPGTHATRRSVPKFSELQPAHTLSAAAGQQHFFHHLPPPHVHTRLPPGDRNSSRLASTLGHHAAESQPAARRNMMLDVKHVFSFPLRFPVLLSVPPSLPQSPSRSRRCFPSLSSLIYLPQSLSFLHLSDGLDLISASFGFVNALLIVGGLYGLKGQRSGLEVLLNVAVEGRWMRWRLGLRLTLVTCRPSGRLTSAHKLVTCTRACVHARRWSLSSCSRCLPP